jgi:hypothetical protein
MKFDYLKQGVLLLSFFLAAEAKAATITVNTTDQCGYPGSPRDCSGLGTDGDDNDNCSLGEAIVAANTDAAVDNLGGTGCTAGSGADTIVLPAGATFTVSARDNGNNAFPLIASPITINGQGATIEGAFVADHSRAFEVGGAGALTLQDLTLAGFGGGTFIPNPGGAILINEGGSASLETVTIAETAAGNGGAIYNGLPAPAPAFMAAAALSLGAATSALTLSNSTLDNNIASLDGGAIYNDAGAAVTITNSALSGNTADSEGGALYNTTGASATITQSLLFLNMSTEEGGGIWNRGTLSVTNSTLTDNQTGGGFGGGLYNTGASTAEFESCTVANNANGTAALFVAGGVVRLHNTIVALNTGGGGGQSQDIAGPVVSLGYNLIGENDGIGGLAATDLSGTVASPLDPQLGSFTGQVYPLLSSSPALDAGDPANCPATDQRGQARPVDGNSDGTARCDIGAYERVPFFAVVSTPTPSSPPPSSPAPADTGSSGESGITETVPDAENGAEVDTAEIDSRTTDEEAANSESAPAGGCSRFVGIKDRSESRTR